MTSNGVFKENKKMTKEPKLPHKLKWGNRTAARADEVGYTGIKDVIIAEVHESVADEVGARNVPEGLEDMDGDVFMKKPRAGA